MLTRAHGFLFLRDLACFTLSCAAAALVDVIVSITSGVIYAQLLELDDDVAPGVGGVPGLLEVAPNKFRRKIRHFGHAAATAATAASSTPSLLSNDRWKSAGNAYRTVHIEARAPPSPEDNVVPVIIMRGAGSRTVRTETPALFVSLLVFVWWTLW